jgi:FkbM family methyltransferase
MSALRNIAREVRDGWQLGMGFPLRHLSRVLGRKLHVTKVKGAGTVHLRTGSSDAEVFVQIFRRKEYDLAEPQLTRILQSYQNILNANVRPIIIDAGANVGAASIWFAKKFPQAAIVAVEPESENAEMWRLNTRSLPNVTLVEAAIGSESGSVSLTNPANEAWAVRTLRSDDGGIAVRTISQIVQEVPQPSRLFLVKIDIEGFEDDLFANNVEWLNDVEVVIIEPHDWLFPGGGKSRNFQVAMANHNFEILISGENLVYVKG